MLGSGYCFQWSLLIEAFTLSEIPLFHVLNARITFGNVNGCSTAEESHNVEGIQADTGTAKGRVCILVLCH